MLSRTTTLPLLLSALATSVLGQDDDIYTVWSSVVFNRIGERTPTVLGNTPTVLTTLGANQAYKAGAFFRDRYISSVRLAPNQDKAPLYDFNAYAPDVKELYALALDTQPSVASAQAFLQGLYPPYTLNESAAVQLEPTSVLANGTYVEAPLEGYQYVQLHTAGGQNPEFPFLAGALTCPAFSYAQINHMQSAQFAATQATSKVIYGHIAGPLLSDTTVDVDQADYINAYAIYDYVNYHATHNATFAALLSNPRYIANTNISYLDALRWYADQQQYAFLGNLTARNNLTATNGLPDNTSGSISTIGGNLLLAKMLQQLQTAANFDAEYYKLSALFGDYQSLISMFALLGLPDLNSNFYGLPDFASSAVFELFSYAPSVNASFPADTSDLWVRFYFRNGTDDDAKYQSFSIFNRGPSEGDMPWTEFEAAMMNVVMNGNGIGDWCTQCGSVNLFCAAWQIDGSQSGSGGGFSTPPSSRRRAGLSPTVAGVIGAIVALVIAGLLFGLLMLVGGMRFYRLKSHKKEMGGFKGSAKLASDRDLTLPNKSGAVVGATVERDASPEVGGGHERIGSWEMKKAEAGRGVPPTQAGESGNLGRLSFEDDEEARRVNPFADPAKADERV